MHPDAAFMESKPGAADVFIPPQIFEILANPLKVCVWESEACACMQVSERDTYAFLLQAGAIIKV